MALMNQYLSAMVQGLDSEPIDWLQIAFPYQET